MKKSLVSAIVGGFLAILAFSAPASATNTTFNNPMQGGNRLDWCVNWATGCGKQAADAWCASKGYQNATNFSQAPNIGASSPTRLIGTGAVCDQGSCDGFSQITCFKPGAVAFNNPKYNGNRVDWCLNWATGCGQQAADAFCQWKGLSHAVNFTEAPDIGASTPTRLMGTGAICDQGFCDGFAKITCE